MGEAILQEAPSLSALAETADEPAFDRAVAELTATFVSLPTEAIDAHIIETIGRVADLLGIDRVHVAQRVPKRDRLEVTHQWTRPGWPAVYQMSEEDVPWLVGRIARGETVAIRTPADWPPEAVGEREHMALFGERSVLALPLATPSELIGALGFATTRLECSWSPSLVERLRLVGKIVANALARKRAEEALQRALAFEHLVARLSAGFVGIPAEALDGRILSALAAVGEFLDLDRATVLQSSEKKAVLRSHQWVRPGVAALDSVESADTYPWGAHRVLRLGETVAVSRLADLPPEAQEERRRFERLGLRSLAAVPLRRDDRTLGALILASQRCEIGWPEDILDRLRLCADVIASALARSRAELDLKAALTDNDRLRRQLEAENLYLREEIEEAGDFGEIVGQSAAIRAALHKTDQVADTDTPVLLLGETGTGKELVARAIHARSRRRDRALIVVNCAALPATLVESELFGHEKGAFTGAGAPKPGRFELADRGTLFLDEVGEIDPAVQAKLLRVLQDGEVQRLGSVRPRKVDVRIVAATNRDLETDIEEGRFRADLFYRLSVFPVELPSLRERREDIPLLVWYFVQSRQRVLGRTIERIPRSDMDALCAYAWPGNVRELQNVVERALILSRGGVLRIAEALGKVPSPASNVSRGSDTMRATERTHILEVLERCQWTIEGPGQAAERLDLKPSTLRNRMKKLGIRRSPRG